MFQIKTKSRGDKRVMGRTGLRQHMKGGRPREEPGESWPVARGPADSCRGAALPDTGRPREGTTPELSLPALLPPANRASWAQSRKEEPLGEGRVAEEDASSRKDARWSSPR